MNVTPVEPAIRRTESKAAKSACEPPYGPSMRAVSVCDGVVVSWEVFGRSEVVDEEADVRRRFVKPLWDFRMKTRSLEWEEGIEAIVAGWDSTRPSLGILRRTWVPGDQVFMCFMETRIFVTPPSIAVRVARPGVALLYAKREVRIARSRKYRTMGM